MHEKSLSLSKKSLSKMNRRAFLLLYVTMRLKRRKENLRRNFNKLLIATFHIMQARRRRLQAQVFLSLLSLLQKQQSSWAFQREESWFTDMWTNRHNLDYHGDFKADF